MKQEHTMQTIPLAFSCRNFIPWNWETVPFSQLKAITELRCHQVLEDQETAVFAAMEELRSSDQEMDGPQKVRLIVTDSSDLLTQEMKWQEQLEGLHCSFWPVFPEQGWVLQWPTFPASAHVPFQVSLPAPSVVCAPSYVCSSLFTWGCLCGNPALCLSKRNMMGLRDPPPATPNQCVFFAPFPSPVALQLCYQL